MPGGRDASAVNHHLSQDMQDPLPSIQDPALGEGPGHQARAEPGPYGQGRTLVDPAVLFRRPELYGWDPTFGFVYNPFLSGGTENGGFHQELTPKAGLPASTLTSDGGSFQSAVDDGTGDGHLFGDWRNPHGLANSPAGDNGFDNGDLFLDDEDYFRWAGNTVGSNGVANGDQFYGFGNPYGLPKRILSNDGFGNGGLCQFSAPQPRILGGARGTNATAPKTGPLQEFLAQPEPGSSTPVSERIEDKDAGISEGAPPPLTLTPSTRSRNGTPMDAGPPLEVLSGLEPASSTPLGDGIGDQQPDGFRIEIPAAAPEAITFQSTATSDTAHFHPSSASGLARGHNKG
ncbi:MAG: hypothetical protein Q9210_003625 [Variospora velana]